MKFFKYFLITCLSFSLAGCSTINNFINNGKDDSQVAYESLVEQLQTTTSFQSQSLYFDLNVDVVSSGNGYDYSIVLSNPLMAMMDIVIVAMDDLGSSEDENAIYSSFDDHQTLNIIPNQSDEENGFVTSVSVNGHIDTLPNTLRFVVSWSNKNKSYNYKEYYVLNIEDELSVNLLNTQ